jgi:thiamine-monophosphate kinase
MVISTDVCIANVHLETTLFPLEDLGYKAITTAVSDIAAMGARPHSCVVALGAPRGTDIEAIQRGIAQASAFVEIPIVGGDVANGDQITISVTVVGEVPHGQAILRSGARAGDVLFVTGPLGGAAAGLRLARDGAPLANELVTAQRRPIARLSEGLAARDADVHAMMDVSDGLSLDLHRLADASGVGFVLEDIPVANGATLDEAIQGGEDYELLMATNDVVALEALFQERGLRRPLRIGRVVADATERTWRGKPFEKNGFQHEL